MLLFKMGRVAANVILVVIFRIWCAFINPKQVTFLDIRSWLFLWLNHFALLNCWEGGSWWSTRVATVFHTSPSFCFPCSKFAGTYSGIWSQMPVSANRVHTPCPYSRIKIMRDLNCLMIINLMVFLYYILSSLVTLRGSIAEWPRSFLLGKKPKHHR